MQYEQTATVYRDTVFQMVPPLFQPLRFWTPRVFREKGCRAGGGKEAGEKNVPPAPSFTIRGGFVNMADGERRMVIAGRIFRQQQEGIAGVTA